ncbi:MAG: PhnD/SsuA/transferrin family substrate-binding protein [Methanolobus sp.]
MKMKKAFFSLFIVAFLIFVSLISPVQSQDEDVLKIGVLVGNNQNRSFEKMQGMDEYLTWDVLEFDFEIYPLDFASMQESIDKGTIDFVIVDPASYVILEQSHGISAIATMETVAYLPPDYTARASVNHVGSAIFAKSDREDIETIGDLSGVSFIAIETPSSEGWWITKRELTEHRINPETDFEFLEFDPDPENVVSSVKNGEFDAGTVPSGLLEKMYMEGKIDINDFKIIHKQEYEDYPFLVSTRLYPGWVFAKTPQTSKSISERVSIYLFSTPFSVSGTGNIGDLAGWTVPQDYSSVVDCLRDLKEGPFKEEFDVIGVIIHFKYFLGGILLLLLLAVFSVLYVNNLNVKLESEIEAKTEAEILLTRRHKIEQTMFKISSMFTYPGDVDEAINNSLSEIGVLCGASRSYLFLFTPDGQFMNNTHEWCSEGVVSHRDDLQDLPSDMFPWWMSKLKNEEMIRVADVSSLPSEAVAEKEILEMQNIKSIIVFPAIIEGKLVGFVGLDEVNGTREWETEDFETLQMFSTLMSMVLKRRKTERSLRESEQHLKRVLEGSNEGTWDVNLQEDLLVFNERYAEIIGYTENEVGTGFEWMKERIHPDDINCVLSTLGYINKGISETAECEYRVMGGDGKYRWVYNRGKVVEYSEDGKPLHMAGILVDISERKAAEATLLAAKKAAEDASRTKSEFLANMSHELRTPLNSVIGFSDLLIEGTFGNLNEKQTKYVNNISNSGKHLLSLINDILDLSKIEAGKMKLNLTEFQIAKSLEEISSTISPLAMKKNIDLNFNIVPENISIRADKGKFRQIIYNLLSNAIKFTDEGGKVGIFVQKRMIVSVLRSKIQE